MPLFRPPPIASITRRMVGGVTGMLAVAAVAAEPTLVWEVSAGGGIESPPAIVDDVVVVTTVDGGVEARQISDGTPRWTRTFDTVFVAPAADDDRRIFVGDVDGTLRCLDLTDGTLRWSADVGGEIDAAPQVAGDVVLVTSQQGDLVALSADAGGERWRYETGDQLRCSPRIIGDVVTLGGCDAKLHRVAVAGGTAAGDPVEIDGPTGSTPAGDDPRRVVLPVMNGVVHGIDIRGGTIVWTYADEGTTQEYRTDAAVDGDLAVVVSARKAVDALDVSTGQRRWRYRLRRRSDAPAVIHGDDVWIAATDGRLIRLDRDDGSERWVGEYRGGFIAGPAIVGDRMYLGDEDGRLRCFAIDGSDDPDPPTDIDATSPANPNREAIDE